MSRVSNRNCPYRLHYIDSGGVASSRILVRQTWSGQQDVADLYVIVAKSSILLHRQQYRHHIAVAFGYLAAAKRITEITTLAVAYAAARCRESFRSIRPLIFVENVKTICVIIHVKLQTVHHIIVRQCNLKAQRVAWLHVRTVERDIVRRVSVCPNLDVMQSAVGVVGV